MRSLFLANFVQFGAKIVSFNYFRCVKTKKRILISPLDWGIGHATRCVPIIKELLKRDYEVVIGAEGRPMKLLMQEFPEVEIIRFTGYNINYSKYLPATTSLIFQIPKIFWNIKRENKILDKIIDDYKIDGVISDSRFGLYTKKVPCVFLTHQLKIKSPFFEKYLQNLNYKFINKFNQCWIIDDEKNNLAGELSMPKFFPENYKYIGPLSRFENIEEEKKYDILCLISGPEPQRTIFEKGLIKAIKKRQEKTLIILGKPEQKFSKKTSNITIKSHLNARELNKAIIESNFVISRSGYSTIMDLVKLGKKAFFIPTPGQTEQEYLARYFFERKICYYQKQENFDLNKALNKSKSYRGFSKIETKIEWESLFSLF